MTALSLAVEADPLPIQIIGVLRRDGNDLFWFRLADGTSTALTFAQLTTRPVLMALFGGSETWLRRNFPGEWQVVANLAGGGRRVSTGIDMAAAANHLAQLCIDAEERAAVAAAIPPTWFDRLLAWLWARHVAAVAAR